MTDSRSGGPLSARPDDCCGVGASTYSDGYAVAFTVHPPSEHTPVEWFTHLMWGLIQKVWPRDLPPPDNPFEGLSLPDHDVFMEGGFVRDEPDLRFWVLRWMDGVVDQSRLVFHCELRLSVDVSDSRSGIDLFFSTCLAGSADSLLVDPVNCTVGHHRLVRHVIERFDSRIGERPLSEKIRSVTGHRAERFMREDLFDRQRRLPILAVSEREDGSGPVVAASELDALELAAMAEIVMLDPGASRAIDGRVGPDLACADGALRIWWPGVVADEHLQAQTLWTPGDLGDDSRRRLLPIRDSLSRTATRRALREDSFWRYSEIEYFSQRDYVAAGDDHIMFPVEITDDGSESGPALRLPGNLSRLLSAGIEPTPSASLEAPAPDPDIGRLRDELASVREDLKKADRAKRRLARDVDATSSQRDQLKADHTAALARTRAAVRDELDAARAATSALDEEIAGLREALARERATRTSCTSPTSRSLKPESCVPNLHGCVTRTHHWPNVSTVMVQTAWRRPMMALLQPLLSRRWKPRNGSCRAFG